MFNKKQSTKTNELQQEMFELLIYIFTPGSKIIEIDNNANSQKNKQASNGQYTIISKPSRQECIVKEEKKVIFEIELGNDYCVFTRGMYLKKLDLSTSMLEIIKSSLQYNPKYDMKHYFELSKSNAKEILTSFKNRNDAIDNGLVKPGEIENSSKLH